MSSINEQIQEGYDRARKTGRVVRQEFSKKAFLLENPDALSDPRLTVLTGETLMIEHSPAHGMTVGELRDLCKNCHEDSKLLAQQKLLSVLGLPDDIEVAILKQDFTELKEGPKPVEIIVSS